MTPKAFLFSSFLLVTICSFAQKKTKNAPPGTTRINDTLYVDEFEVANVHWREYIYYLQKFDSLNYENGLPDTAVWVSDTAFSPMSEYYFRHPGFNNYPVVGISYEQAVEFCKWRTFAANLAHYIKESGIKNWQQHLADPFPIKFYYRLPTKEEWEILASGKLSKDKYPYGYDSIYIKWKKNYAKSFNCKYPNDKPVDPHSPDRAYYTASTKSFLPNSSGTYNMIGNVAEMIAGKGIAKGGSFIHPVDSCKIIFDQHYSKPEKWLGFRCVAVLVK